jgi:hypothetical protein
MQNCRASSVWRATVTEVSVLKFTLNVLGSTVETNATRHRGRYYLFLLLLCCLAATPTT